MSGRGQEDLGFRELAARHFSFLDELGFRRSREDETEGPVGASIAYVGPDLGLRVSIDERDRCVSVRVTAARDGRLAESPPAGHSQDLLQRLVERHGYRGGGARGATELIVDRAALDRVLAAWAGFVRREGRKALETERA